MVQLSFEVYDNFPACEPTLQRLAQRLQHPNPFLQPEWLNLWWEYFGAGKSLYIMVCRHNGEAIGYAPFYRIYRSALGLHEYYLLGDGYSSYLDLACPQGYEDTFLSALFLHFQNLSSGAIVQFRDINNRFSYFYQALENAWKQKLNNGMCFNLYSCPLVTFAGNWDEFYKNRHGSKARKNLRRKIERLTQTLGSFCFRRVTDPGELDYLLPHLERMHGERFTKTVNIVLKGQKLLLLRSALSKMLNDNLYLFVSELDNCPISFLIGFKMGATFIAFIMAFDPAFSLLALGHVQLIRIMEAINQEGYTVFDFSKGDAEYKRYWSNAETTSHMFRFGFQLSRPGQMYYRLLNGTLEALVYLRHQGYNRTIKHWLARLRQGDLLRKEASAVKIEELKDQVGVTRPEDYPEWSYRIIRGLSPEVRSAIIKCVIKTETSQLRVDHRPQQRTVT
ncbi:MAG: hypothetical protein BZ151_11465, partial [Desulfobacca sp. 4484_104]